MGNRDRQVKQKDTERVMRFLSDGLNDYVGARVLFLNNLLEQGAMLASTAVEKYLKAMLATHGEESHKHLKKAHWASVRNKYPELFAQMNESFLLLCQKCYQLRYTMEVPRGYNVVIASREFLAELDHTVLVMQTKFVQADANGNPTKTKFALMVEQRDERLLKDNHVLLCQPKEAFIYGATQIVHELRRMDNGAIAGITYPTKSIPESRSFMREAFVSKPGDGRSYTLSHTPLP